MRPKPPPYAVRASAGQPALRPDGNGLVRRIPQGVRGRARLGKPRLLIIGCGKVGLTIVARLNRRFRVIATTTSSQQRQAPRQAGPIPMLIVSDARAPNPPPRLSPPPILPL